MSDRTAWIHRTGSLPRRDGADARHFGKTKISHLKAITRHKPVLKAITVNLASER